MDNLFARDWEVPLHAYVPPLVLAALNIAVWSTFSDSTGGMPLWALSWPAFRAGHVLTLFTQMFAHGGIIHLAVNTIALLLVSPPLISRLGPPIIAWFRYTYLYLGSGLCGGGLFLILNTSNSATMLGASGAIFGILAALARVHPHTGTAVAVRSRRTWLLAKLFLQNHIALLLLLALVTFFADNVAGLAWEAHLGGLLFGFFAAPLYLPRDLPNQPNESDLERS
jgi:membrane associated rhomboid family serine protease